MAAHEDLSRAHEVKTSSNRAFGWVFTVVFLLFGLWPLLSQGSVRVWLLVVSAIFLVLTLLAPALLAVPNRLWQSLGQLLNRIVSPVVLLVLFYVVMTPMGVLMRAFSDSRHKWRRDAAQDTYWIKREPPGPKPDSLNHQF